MNTPSLVARTDARNLPQWSPAAPGYLDMQAANSQDPNRQATRLGLAMRRWWWLALLIWAVIAIPATILVYKYIPAQYVAVRAVEVKPVMINPVSNNKETTPFYLEFLRTQAELMKNPFVLKEAAASVPLSNFAWFRQLPDQVAFLTDHVQVEPIGSTQIIRISMAHEDPKFATAIVDSVFDAYIKQYNYNEEHNGNASLQVLKNLQAATDKSLKDAQEKLAQLNTDDDNVVWTDLDRKVFAEALANAKQTFAKLSSEQLALEAQIANLKSRQLPTKDLYFASIQTDNDPQIDQWMKARITTVMLDNTLASKRATDQHPDRVSYRKQIRALDEKIAARRKEILDNAWSTYQAGFELDREKKTKDAEADLGTLKQQIAALNTRIGEQETISRRVGSKLQPIASLRELVADNKEALKRYNDRIEETENMNRAAGLVSSTMQTVEPRTPTVDRRPKLAAMANAFGLALGLGVVLLMMKLRDKIDHQEDLPNTFQPLVVGTVSHSGAAARGLPGRMSKKILGEEMRLLHANLLPPGPMTRRIMMVTSPTPSNGKTSIASQLALSLAKSGLDVLLVDADLRKRDLSTMFDVGFRPGLADLLQGKPPELIRPMELLPNLRLMGAGSKLERNPVELLQRKHFHESLNLLQDKFDVIIVDTPPTLVVADARLIARSCDEVLCVVRAQVSSPKDVNQTIDALSRITGKTPKIILNGVAHRGSYYKYKFAYASHEGTAADAAEELQRTQE